MKTFTWKLDISSSETTSLNVQTIAFGDGYEQAVSHGINNARRTWQATIKDTKAVVDEIHRFLLATKGVEPFLIRPIATEPSLKVRLDGEISRTHLGGNAWQIGFNLKQVF